MPTRLQAICLSLILPSLACVTLTGRSPTPAPPPTRIIFVDSTPIVVTATPMGTPLPDERAIKDAIQETLDLYAQAYNDNNPDLLTQVVDQDNKPFRRFVRTRFDLYGAASGYTVKSIEQRALGFVLAHLRTRGGYAADWLFREVDGRWVLSEPTVAQIGEPTLVETEHFIFETYAWSDDVNAQLITMMETARENVFNVLGQVPDEKAQVKIRPIYGLSPFEDPFAAAQYESGSAAISATIQIFAPNSFTYGYYDPAIGWEADLQQILTHEYTHMVHDLSFDNAGRLNDWLSEGLAEYVSGADNRYATCDAVNRGHLIPIVDPAKPVRPQDLMHMQALDEDRGLAYGFAQYLVTYIVEEHGGLDGLWNYIHTYDKTPDIDKAMQSAFGLSYAEFDKDWRAWLKKQC